ncbi:MAG TPA: hypothetical protein VIJ51_08555 [Solirubrobacteraceae bacterium]
MASSPKAAPPAAPSGASYAVNMAIAGGYAARATLVFGHVQHVVPGDVPGCSVNPASDAEVPGTLTVTNLTPNFPLSPGIELSYDSETLTDSSGSACSEYLYFRATGPLSFDQSIHEGIWIIFPNYYTPNTPQGSPASYAAEKIGLSYADQTADSDGPGTQATVTVTGPGVTSSAGQYGGTPQIRVASILRGS